MSDDVERYGAIAGASAVFVVIAVLIATDLALDYAEGASWPHLAIELLVLIAAIAGVLLLWVRLRQVRSDLAGTRSEAAAWRREHQALVDGLGSAIREQLATWQLSTAEAEIALLLLKGCSLKEIARLRGTSERTVREQARAVYRKSGLAGRSSLSAFFLEDLLPPVAPASGADRAVSEPS